jgi:hypothetical protein
LYSADNCKYISNPFHANSNRRSEEAHPPFSPRALPLGGHLQEQPAAPVVEDNRAPRDYKSIPSEPSADDPGDVSEHR